VKPHRNQSFRFWRTHFCAASLLTRRFAPREQPNGSVVARLNP
jgi:hypothetical protein